MNLVTWIHHLFNPHCEICEAKEADANTCDSCETLKAQLAHANYENEVLLRAILDKDKPQEAMPIEVDDEPIKPKIVPWNVRKQMLEAEDRQKAKLLKEQKDNQAKAIEELEKNLGLDLEEGKANVQSKPV